MKRNIIIFIAIIAISELFVAFLFENNKDFTHIIIKESSHASDEPVSSVDNPYSLYNICIDVSCITSDSGEKKQSQLLGEKLKLALRDEGFKVSSTNPDLPDRERAAKASRYDLAITLSADGGYDYDGDKDFESGIGIYVHPKSQFLEESTELGQLVKENITFDPEGIYSKRRIRGVLSSASYSFLSHCKVPAVLVVYGHFEDESEILHDDLYLNRVAEGITNGIKKYAQAHPAGQSIQE